ncbi:hypothetical protein ACX12M_06410 [Cellulosimicrobium cellulans]
MSVLTHWVRTDDACRVLLTADGGLICPVHTGLPRPTPSRACAVGAGLTLCQVCLRGGSYSHGTLRVQRSVCADCLAVDSRLTSALGVPSLAPRHQDDPMKPRMRAYVTLVFPERWRLARATGLPVLRLDPSAPYWGRRTVQDGIIEDAMRPRPERHFTWHDHWAAHGSFDDAARRAAYLAWVRGVHPASVVASATAGEIR